MVSKPVERAAYTHYSGNVSFTFYNGSEGGFNVFLRRRTAKLVRGIFKITWAYKVSECPT